MTAQRDVPIATVAAPEGPTGRSAVVCSGLVYRFGNHTAVDHVDLRIEQRETFGLLGPNGAGKTTTEGKYISESTPP